ncbi:MAG: glutathione peroxidase [Deltaproteobacteria bacterium]|jgi:glutathione peroxidase|nr:glutathione peroxidase [Deltaproteobacteria bacterium]
MGRVYDFEARRLNGEPEKLSAYQGKVLLIVNTASKCGFTSQYSGLEALYGKYRARGLEILGFPCNQFGKQEPGGSDEIAEFCSVNYGVTFPMFEKIDVNGKNAHPLFQYLKSEAPGLLGSEPIKWNFTKFLVDRGGEVVERYASATKPEQLEADIEAALG